MTQAWVKYLHIAAITVITLLIALIAGHLVFFHVLHGRANIPLRRLLFGSTPAAAPTVRDPFDYIEQMQRQIDTLFAITSNNFPAGVTAPAGGSRDAARGNFDPFTRMQQMQADIDRMFARAFDDVEHFGPPPGFDEGWDKLAVSPALEWHEDTNAYVITLTMPNVAKSDIHVSLSGPVLNIVVESRATNETGQRGQSAWSSAQTLRKFERHLRLPAAPADSRTIRADFDKGVLRIVVPKPDRPEPLEKTIPIL